MDNLNNPFGVPSPGQPQGQPDQSAPSNVPLADQQAKSSTFIDELRLKNEAEKELLKKLDKKIRETERKLWDAKKKVVMQYGKWSLIGFGIGSLVGFRFGGKDNVSSGRS